MRDARSRSLDAEALALFARKGFEAGPEVPQAGEANAVKVRRVLQLTADLARRPFDRLRILDLGCGEGVYAIEAALRGAEVVAIDARSERLAQGEACATRHGLTRLHFRREDVRRLRPSALGHYDVVYALGLLYHLDAPDIFGVLTTIAAVCRGMTIVDTLVSLEGPDEHIWHGQAYRGTRVREHQDDDPPEVRRGRLLRSLDNTFAFRLTRPALVRALHAVGFRSVLECHVPYEPGKAADRITLVATVGTAVELATYPWINGKSEADIARRIEPTRS